MANRLKAYLALLCVTLIWGVTFSLINRAASDISASLFVLLRFLLALMFFFPFAFMQLRYKDRAACWGGFWLGIANAVALITQTVGLRTLDPATSAFVSALSVIFVPLITIVFNIERPRRIDFVAALLCIIGVYILTGANLAYLNSGIAWTILSAFAYAIVIILLQHFGRRARYYRLLVFYQILFTSVFAGMTCIVQPQQWSWSQDVVIGLLFCGIFSTVLVFILQTRYQHYLPASHVAIIYTLEPFFASLFGYFLVGEQFSSKFILGGALIIFSIVLMESSEWWAAARAVVLGDVKCG